MKHTIIWIVILAIFIPISTWAEEKTGPRMVIVAPVFDAGKVDQGSIINHKFIVKNTGDEELRITRVNPG